MKVLITVITINLLMLFAAHTAQAQTLSDKVTEWTNAGYTITATGVTSAGTSAYLIYYVQFINADAPENILVHCQRYNTADEDKAVCYKM